LLEQCGRLVASTMKRAARRLRIIWNFSGPTIFVRTGQKLISRLTESMRISTLPPTLPCNWQPKRKQLCCPDILERPPATEVYAILPHAAKAGRHKRGCYASPSSSHFRIHSVRQRKAGLTLKSFKI